MAPFSLAACLLSLASLTNFAVNSHCRWSCVYACRVNSYCLPHHTYFNSNLTSYDTHFAVDLPSSKRVSENRPVCRVKYGKSPTSYYNNTVSTFNIALNVLLLSGDVHVNPGPTSSASTARERESSPSEHKEHTTIDHCHHR